MQAIASNSLGTAHCNALKTIKAVLEDKAKQALATISNAHYSAIHCYYKSNKLIIHSGANVDPSSIELLKSRKHRNCAEKQAANSAAAIDLLANPSMQIMFLYREANSGMPAEKLVPCIDCYQTYITDLIKNNGKLVLILDDDAPRDFVSDASYDNSVSQLGDVYYKVLDAKALMNLNIEPSLGGRVCTEHQS